MVSLFRKKFFGNLDVIEKDVDENVDIYDNFTEEEALQKFRLALKESKNKWDISMDDATLLRFLRVKSFKVQAAVELAQRSQEMRRKNPNIFDTPFHKCKTSLDTGHLVVLRQRDLHGRRVIVYRTKYYYPEEDPLENVISLAFHGLEELLLSKETQAKGIAIIFDTSDVPLSRMAHIVSHFTFAQMSRIISFLQGGYPVRVKSFHIVSAPFIVATTYQGVKYLISKKMRNRMHIQSGGPSRCLHEHFGKENLPDFLEGDIKYEDCVDKDFIKTLYSKNSF